MKLPLLLLFCVAFLSATVASVSAQTPAQDAAKLYAAIKASERPGDVASTAHVRAIDLNSVRKYELAIALLDLLIRDRPSDYWLYKTRAYSNIHWERPDAALPDLEIVLRLKPDEVESLNGRAKLLKEKRRYPDALIDLDRSIRLEPKDWWPYALRRDTYTAMGQHEKGLDDYVQVVKIQGEWEPSRTYSMHTDEHIKAGDYAGAIADLNRLIAAFPNYKSLYGQRSRVYRDMKKFDLALADVNKVIEMEPRLYVLRARALIYELQGRYDLALADYSRNIAGSSMVLSNEYAERANVYMKLGNIKAAIGDLTNAIKSGPSLWEPVAARAKAYCVDRAFDLAKADEAKVKELGGTIEKPCQK